MLKNILKLDGAQQLSKKEQKNVNGGYYYISCNGCFECPPQWFCNGEHCVPCKYGDDVCCYR